MGCRVLGSAASDPVYDWQGNTAGALLKEPVP
jgi:hypothetical protein